MTAPACTGNTHTVTIIDAFARKPFEGNPAAVVMFENWPADEVMQAIAAEHNLAETAFLIAAVDEDIDYRLRWFTPTIEMDLCGHATLASAHAVREAATDRGDTAPARVAFTSRSGRLVVTADDATGRLSLDFPARPPAPVDDPDLLDAVTEALGARPSSLHRSRDLLAVFKSAREVAQLDPDFALFAELDALGVIATAPAQGTEPDSPDVVSRFFAPEAGVDEDPVTGSAHCTIVPYWANRLGKPELIARQISPRGGTLWCRHRAADERVDLAGHAVTYLKGTIRL